MSKYRGENGIYLTKGLFFEWGDVNAPYTLRPDDHVARSGNEYKSFSKIYLECTDEYEAAQVLLGSWSHWEKLCKVKWFMDGLTSGTKELAGLKEWRKEMKLRDESRAKKALMDAIAGGDTSAAKFVYGQTNKKETAGRPQKNKPSTSTNNSKVASLVASIDKRKAGNGV